MNVEITAAGLAPAGKRQMVLTRNFSGCVLALVCDQRLRERAMKVSNAIKNGEIDPSVVVAHRLPLADAAQGYKIFLNKEDRCEKVVLKT
jgi:threonine dehydrogenase-like Zn-dependent dehydrogenase